MCVCLRSELYIQFWTVNKVFEIFEKNRWIFKTSIDKREKKGKFGTKYLKTHVHRVIWKMVFPHPQLDIKICNPQECWWQFLSIYISRYIYVLYTNKVWRTMKDTFETPSIHPIPSHPSIHPIRKFNTPLYMRKKNDKFGTKFLKTYAHRIG